MQVIKYNLGGTSKSWILSPIVEYKETDYTSSQTVGTEIKH